MNSTEQKSQLRQEIRVRIDSLGEDEKNHQSATICARLVELLPPKTASVAGYMPLPDEADVVPFLRHLLREEIALFLPRYEGGAVTFHRVTSLEEELKQSDLKIHEPHPHLPPLDPRNLDLVLVPGRAFDAAGNRLGRGKGGYDRFIAEQRATNPSTQFWGIAFREQLLDAVPAEAHDQRMDSVVTANQYL